MCSLSREINKIMHYILNFNTLWNVLNLSRYSLETKTITTPSVWFISYLRTVLKLIHLWFEPKNTCINYEQRTLNNIIVFKTTLMYYGNRWLLINDYF